MTRTITSILVTCCLILLVGVVGYSQTKPTRQKAGTTRPKQPRPKDRVTQPNTTQPQETPEGRAATPNQPSVDVKQPVRPPNAEKPKDEGRVSVDAKLERARYVSGNVHCPTWKVSVTIHNDTSKTLQLGESLMIVEKANDPSRWVVQYIGRKGANQSTHLDFLDSRYSDGATLLGVFGYEIGDTETYTALPLVFSRDILEYMAGITVVSGKPYEGLGYGRVAPRSLRTLEAMLYAPVGLRDAATRDYVTVVLPSIQPVGEPGIDPTVTICRFDALRDDSGYLGGAACKLAETTSIRMTPTGLRTMISDTKLPLWQRVFAFNWVTDTYGKEANGFIAEIAANNNDSTVLRLLGALNLGVLKNKAASPYLVDIARNSRVSWFRRDAIKLLGEIGDTQAVRTFISDEDDSIATDAIEVLGKIKDGESVAVLSAILKDANRSKRHGSAATALAKIGNPAAMGELLALVRSGKNETRELVAENLGLAGSAEAVGALTAIAADARESAALRRKALASVSQIGGTEAMAALRAASESGDAHLRASAISSLAQAKDATAIETLIQLAERPGYPSRGSVVETLGNKKTAGALPALRRIVADKQAPSDVRRQACDALANMKDQQAAAALLAAADDSDSALYAQALKALETIGAKEANESAVAALHSKHPSVRESAASLLRFRKWSDAVMPLWQAYQAETKEDPAEEIASALIELKFADKSAVPLLIGRLDPKKNPQWYQDVRLLQHLTGKEFGPGNKRSSDKIRNAELIKWRQWWEGESTKKQ